MTDRPSWEAERRSIDRRVGLPDSRPAGARVDRRMADVDRRRRPDRRVLPPNRGVSDRDEQRHLVLYIAADPARQEWLRRFLARHLEATASALSAAKNHGGAETVRGIADRIRTGDASLW